MQKRVAQLFGNGSNSPQHAKACCAAVWRWLEQPAACKSVLRSCLAMDRTARSMQKRAAQLFGGGSNSPQHAKACCAAVWQWIEQPAACKSVLRSCLAVARTARSMQKRAAQLFGNGSNSPQHAKACCAAVWRWLEQPAACKSVLHSCLAMDRTARSMQKRVAQL